MSEIFGQILSIFLPSIQAYYYYFYYYYYLQTVFRDPFARAWRGGEQFPRNLVKSVLWPCVLWTHTVGESARRGLKSLKQQSQQN
jgi:hypothetical protein